MNTSQADSTPADDAAGTSNGTNASGQGTGEGKAGEGKGRAAGEVRGWFTGRLPGDWFTAAPDIQADREEITIVGVLPAPETAGASDAERAAAAEGRIRRFREETRNRRIEIAREAEHKFRRKVSWGVTCADVTEMFTTLSVPVMTRLRQPERRVLDTLVEAGVARSRSDALAWCVRCHRPRATSTSSIRRCFFPLPIRSVIGIIVVAEQPLRELVEVVVALAALEQVAEDHRVGDRPGQLDARAGRGPACHT